MKLLKKRACEYGVTSIKNKIETGANKERTHTDDFDVNNKTGRKSSRIT